MYETDVRLTISSGSSGRSVALPVPVLRSILCLMRRMIVIIIAVLKTATCGTCG